MDLDPILVVIHIINVAVLYVLLRLILYKPIHEYLQKRALSIENDLNNAKNTVIEAEEYKASYEERLHNVELESKKVALAITKEADLSAIEIVNQAKSDAESILAESRLNSEAEHKEMILALKGQIADLSLELAGEILNREVTEEDNLLTIDSFFSRVAGA
jgi:F-type H+-transporting ATPase subunit b